MFGINELSFVYHEYRDVGGGMTETASIYSFYRETRGTGR